MKFLDTESDNPGPALLDKDPVVLPEQRKKAADKLMNLGN